MNIHQSAIALETNETHGRYVYRFEDGSEAELIFFERPEGVVTIEHTETPKEHRGQGVAGVILKRALGDFRAQGKKVIPACPYAYKRFREHPEWADLLTRR